jgi:hypothetical protein
MRDDTRAAITDLAVLGVAAVAVYYVAKTPPLRRLAWQFIKYGVLTAGPALLRQEVSRAWAESARPVSADAYRKLR